LRLAVAVNCARGYLLLSRRRRASSEENDCWEKVLHGRGELEAWHGSVVYHGAAGSLFGSIERIALLAGRDRARRNPTFGDRTKMGTDLFFARTISTSSGGARKIDLSPFQFFRRISRSSLPLVSRGRGREGV